MVLFRGGVVRQESFQRIKGAKRMKRLFVLCLVVCSGCVTANIETVSKDGATCKGSYSSMFRKVEGANINACDSSGQSNVATPKGGESLLSDVIKALL